MLPSSAARHGRAGVAVLAGLLAAMIGGLAPLSAQEPPPGQQPPPAQEPPPAQPPQEGPGAEAPPAEAGTPEIHPDAVSTFQVRSYKFSRKKLWKGLLQVLQESGYPPEEVDEKGKRVKTSFVDFNSKDYSDEVADPAPRLGAGYHILQMNKIRMGKVSIEGVVSEGDQGAAVLSLRARILVDGLDQRRRVRQLTDRRSSGVIESDFLRRLEDTLKLERIK